MTGNTREYTAGVNREPWEQQVLHSAACRAIAQILKEYEKATGRVVRSLGITGMDVTTIESTEQQCKMIVVMETERLPAHGW